MATRSFDDLARSAASRWTPEVNQFAARFNAELEGEATAQVELGRQIAAARKASCLTQAELSARAFVQQAEISRIERGLGNPTRDTLLRLASAMGTRLVLIPDDGPPTPDHRT